MDIITSTSNSVVKRLRALRDSKAREAAGQMLVEGAVMIREALKCALRPYECLSAIGDEALENELRARGARVYAASREAVDAACLTKTPQGVCAAFELPPRARPARLNRLVALDGVQDPGNLGAIWRTADAAGLDAILLGEGCADPYSPKAQRAAMGSGFRVPALEARSLAGELRALRAEGFKVYVSSLKGEIISANARAGDKWALVIGSEARGVSDEAALEADALIKLPMRGGAESLNAAVAAGILMYALTSGD